MFNFLKNSHVLYNLKLVGKRNCVIIDYESGVSPTSRGKKKKKKMALRKKNFLYKPQDYYDVITQCRKHNKFILHEMKRENFVSTKNLQNAIKKQIRRNTNGEKVNWLQMHHTLFYIKH